ncbi:MAG: DNA-protecting protein DprA [Aigarchaeota archaeon]|nr:DNA-protecting protein DprA [Candidatus Calditenuis fumarioli]
MFEFTELRPEDLLGSTLNEYEAKYAPKRLQVVGEIQELVPLPVPRVSVVGTRQPTDEGIAFARRLVENLVRERVIIVSGLARGIDTVAHRTALEKGGRTIAVLGTPLDRFYPPENRELQLMLMREHLVISQFPIGSPVTRKNFVLRNRTMALISNATVIVEAGEKSGVISQAWESIRLNRPLFVSRLVESRRPSWVDELMKYGAMVLQDPDELDELLDLLPWMSPQELVRQLTLLHF